MSADHAALVVQYAPFVWRVLIHLGVPTDRLEDASQDVFLVLISGKFRGASSLETFLYGVCRNVASVERRKRQDAVELVLDELPDSIMQPAQEGELWIKTAHARLVRALGLLDEAQQQVFVLFELEQMPMEEIARLMKAPLSTCYSRLYAARAAVQAELRRGALSKSVEVSS